MTLVSSMGCPLEERVPMKYYAVGEQVNVLVAVLTYQNKNGSSGRLQLPNRDGAF